MYVGILLRTKSKNRYRPRRKAAKTVARETSAHESGGSSKKRRLKIQKSFRLVKLEDSDADLQVVVAKC